MTKLQQLYKNKPKTDLSDAEKKAYFTWIKQNKKCVVCGRFPEIHHITSNTIKGRRRSHKRVLNLCFNHHSAQSEELSIHGNTQKFYEEYISLELLLTMSEKMYKEYLDEQ